MGQRAGRAVSRATTIAAIALTSALPLSSCATSFHGEPHFSGGPRQCWEKCQAVQMEMAAYVYVGEYSSACVCEPLRTPGAPATPVEGAPAPVAATGATAAAAVAVASQESRVSMGSSAGP